MKRINSNVVIFPNSKGNPKITPEGLQREIEILNAEKRYLLKCLQVEKVMTNRYRKLWSIVIQHLTPELLSIIKNSTVYTRNEIEYTKNMEIANNGGYVK